MITANLTWKIQCADCPAETTESFSTTWFHGWSCGNLSEEELGGDNAIYQAELNGWEFERITYEELEARCPNCKKNR